MKKLYLFVAVIASSLSQAPISLSAQGELWGVTQQGGADGGGTIFKTNLDGTGLSIQNSFKLEFPGWGPPEGLIFTQALNGKLYGTTSRGGSNDRGLIFEYDPTNGAYVAKVNFDYYTTGATPTSGLTLSSNGKMYGVIQSFPPSNWPAIYEFDPITSAITIKANFANFNIGSLPTGRLIEGQSGIFYGVTTSGGPGGQGCLFEWNLSAGSCTPLVSFNSTNGARPYSAPVIASNGKIYGTTSQGGANNLGVLYEYNISTTNFVQYDMTASGGSNAKYSALVEAPNGKLYGTTSEGGANNKGVIFQYDFSNGTYSKLFDFGGSNGEQPMGLMIASNNKLYGMTKGGGSPYYGVIFEFDPTTSTYLKKLDFNASTGSGPYGTLMQASNGKLFGVTLNTLFDYDFTNNSIHKIGEFNNGINGQYPVGGLVKADNGKLYGLAQGGQEVVYTFAGNSYIGHFGVLYEYDPATNMYSKKLDLDEYGIIGNSGMSLMKASNGKLYGMTDRSNVTVVGNGKLFEYDPTTNQLQTLQVFNQTIGGAPRGELTEVDGVLYGLASQWGANGQYTGGTLFEYNLTTSIFSKRFDFSPAEGISPIGKMVHDNGKLYGICSHGGLNDGGTLFEYDISTGVAQKKSDLYSASAGSTTSGYLMKASNGLIYGTAGYRVFEYNPTTNIFQVKFNVSPNGTFNGGLIESPNGKLYGTTSKGVFEFNLNTGTYSVVFDFFANGIKATMYPIGSLTYRASNQIISFNPLPAKTYGDPQFLLNATASSGLPVSYTSSNPAVATVAGNQVTIISSGTTDITATQPGNFDFYPANAVQQTLVVNKAPLTTTAIDQSRTYGDPNPTLTFSYSGFVNGENATVLDTEPIASTVDPTYNAGTYSITLSGGVDDNYNFLYVNGSLTINKANLTVTVEDKSKIYGDVNPTLTYTYSGFKLTDGSGDLDSEPSVQTSADPSSPVGIYPITLSGGSDNNYLYLFINGTLTITKAILTATADSKSKEYGEDNPSLTIAYSGFKGSDTVLDINTQPTISTIATTNSPVDNYDITLSGGLDDNYSFNLINGILTVTKAVLTVTANDQTKTYGDLNPTLSFAYSGFKGTDDYSSLEAQPITSTSAQQFSPVGAYTILLSGGLSTNYSFNFVNGILTIDKAVLTITADDKVKAYGEAIPLLTMAYSGFLGTDGISDLQSEPVITTSATQTSNTGTYPISLAGGADDNYLFTLINGTLTIIKADQVITFNALPTKSLGDPDFALTATGGGSNNPITYQSSNATVLTIDGSNVTITGAGSSIITASQLGNINYNDAPPVQQVQQVILPKPTLPTSYIFLVNEFATQMDYFALPGDGMARLVVLKKDGPIDFVPTDDIGYTVGQTVGTNYDNFIGLILSGSTTYGTIKNLEPGASYYVKVFEFNQSNEFYSYLTTATATSGQITMPQVTAHVITPANNYINATVPTVTVASSTVPGATTYTIELYTNSWFEGTPLVKSGAASQSFAVAYNTQYYTRVKTNLSETYGPSTTFITEPPEADAYVTVPVNNSVGNLVTLTVTSNTVTGASVYTIELSTSSDFSSNVIVGPGSSVSQTFSNLDFSTTYYTRVKTNLSPNYGVTRSFTTGDPLSLSYVATPANNATGQVPTLNVTANALTGATSYTIELSPDATFVSGVISKNSASRTISFPQLEYYTKYYSRVSSSLTPGQWGPIRNFTTLNHTFQTAPANNSTNVFVTQTITASAVSGAGTNSYTIEANTAPDFTGTSIIKTGSRTQTFALQYDMQYYIRARCSLAAPTSWGTTITFHTGTPQTLAIVTSPANGSTVSYSSSQAVIARVLPADGVVYPLAASSYTIELNTLPDFSGTSIVQSNSTNTVTLTGLVASTTYYTRVKTDLDPNWGTTITSFTTTAPGGRTASDPQPAIQLPVEQTEIKIFGNPFTYRLVFIVNAPVQEDVEIILADLNGKPIHQSTERTNTFLELEPQTSAGVYVLIAKTSKYRLATKVIKQD